LFRRANLPGVNAKDELRMRFFTYKIPKMSLIKRTLFSLVVANSIGFNTRAQLAIEWPEVGQLQVRDAKEIKASTWSIGGETLDRDYTDYQSYKKYLGPLGAKRIRLQGGWSKCEKVKGVYNFEWLDSIIPDAAARGVYPWVELSYGNPIYEGGGEAKLAGHIPTSPEALTAWDNWVKAMVSRYKSQVPEWEIWNEPDLNRSHTGKEIGEFYLRTAKLVRAIHPEARLIALGMASVTRLDFVKDFMEYLKANNGLEYIDIFTYHGYSHNPDESYPKIEILRELVWTYKPSIVFMQGENGAPSTPKEITIGALRDKDWSELTQAKWNLRRMLGDHGRGIATNLFTISDIHYAPGDHMVGINTKGILKTNPDKTIERPKLAYKAVQRVFSLFDDQLKVDSLVKVKSTSANQSYFAYTDRKSRRLLITIWQREDRPAELYQSKNTTINLEGVPLKNPVVADPVTGKVYKIPKGNLKKSGSSYILKDIPVPDYPIIIAESSLLKIDKKRSD
jgi:Glycosyl hydrolases family 39